MITRTYPVGETVFLTTTFLDPQSGRAVNPSNVVLRLLSPAGVETRPTVYNPEAGVFNAQFTPANAGRWHIRWEGSGLSASVIESAIEITPSAFS